MSMDYTVTHRTTRRSIDTIRCDNMRLSNFTSTKLVLYHYSTSRCPLWQASCACFGYNIKVIFARSLHPAKKREVGELFVFTGRIRFRWKKQGTLETLDTIAIAWDSFCGYTGDRRDLLFVPVSLLARFSTTWSASQPPKSVKQRDTPLLKI